MKFKSIIACGLLLLGVGASTTSCEDMFTAENSLVETDFAPKDTIYQIMGIVQRMQVLAERSVLLGELRADLVDIDPAHSTTYVQELANNESGTIKPWDYATAKGNIYNQPSDYYAVINNCNIYLDKVDSLRKASGVGYFKKEIIAAKTFRAWCYLELAKVYGEVPFVTTPVLDAKTAEDIVKGGEKKGLKEITDFCIDDLKAYANEKDNGALRPGDNDANNKSYSVEHFIPVRVMLGELYLWRGSATNSQQDFIDAVRMYHDYLTYKGEEIITQYYPTVWLTSAMYKESDNSYSNYETYFDYDNKNCAAIARLDTIGYYGNYADIRNVFNSTYENHYYPAAKYSDRLKKISQSQKYCYYYYISNTNNDTIYSDDDESVYPNLIQKGDLRLSSLYKTRNLTNRYDDSYAKESFINAKYSNGFNDASYISPNDKRQQKLPYYRVNTLYLHMAEALNRAGFPETAFAVLKYGITEKTLMDRSRVSMNEFERLGQIKVKGQSQHSLNLPDELDNSFLVWNEDKFIDNDKNSTTLVIGSNMYQLGIHSLGSGDSEYNKYYVLPTDSSRYVEIGERPVAPVYDKKNDPDSTIYNEALAIYEVALPAWVEQDSINHANLYEDSYDARVKFVAEKILDEGALENCFEGTRFYDLMRYQMAEQGGVVFGTNSTITLPAYLEEKYGATPRQMVGKPWYLPLK